jgi:hypothetical protein
MGEIVHGWFLTDAWSRRELYPAGAKRATAGIDRRMLAERYRSGLAKFNFERSLGQLRLTHHSLSLYGLRRTASCALWEDTSLRPFIDLRHTAE